MQSMLTNSLVGGPTTSTTDTTVFSKDLFQQCIQLVATHSFTEVTSCCQEFYQWLVTNNLIMATTTSSSSSKDPRQPHTMAALLCTCEPLLHKLQESHPHSWVYMAPVDANALGLHDYFLFITNPMDLGTVYSNLQTGAYTSMDQFASDVKLVFDNAMTYNPVGTDVHTWATEMKQTFLQQYHNLLSHLLLTTTTTAITTFNANRTTEVRGPYII
jgi:hypothetical protein